MNIHGWHVVVCDMTASVVEVCWEWRLRTDGRSRCLFLEIIFDGLFPGG